MKLLRVISSINPALGGTMEAARLIDAELLRSGHQVDLVCLDDPSESYLNKYPAPVHALGPSVGFYHYNKNLVSWLKKNVDQYDAVLIDGLWQYHSYAVYLGLRGSKVPYYIFPHGMLDPWFKKYYPLKHIKKAIYWLLFEYRVLKNAKAVLFTCEEERLLACQSFRPYHCSEKVVSLGIECPPEYNQAWVEGFLETFPVCREKKLVLFLGRIHEKKGCDILIDAFAGVAQLDQSLHLIMAGPDQMSWVQELKALAQKNGIESRVTWTGMLVGDQKWGAFYAADVFILPSHQENFGIAVVEALGCGKPVLISNKVNIWREIDSDNAGWVADDTYEGCLSLLKSWNETSVEQMQIKQQAAKRSFATRYQIKSMVSNLVNDLSKD